MKYYLGIDNGGTVTKAALYTKEGKLVALEQELTEVDSPQAGFIERDMERMKQANFKAVKSLIDKNNIDPSMIAGIACCGHGKGLYLVDSYGKPCRAGILSSDNRAWEYPVKWEKEGTAEKVYEKTFQAVMACQPVALLAWLKDHENKTYSTIKWVFECKDYVRFFFTGSAYAEMTDYSGANLVNLKTKSYDKELLKLFGISEVFDALPPLVSSVDQCGSVNAEAAKATGLIEGTPMFGGMFDIDACAVAVNVTNTDNICMIAGTWSINEYLSKTPVMNHKVAMNSISFIKDYYLIEESSATSAVNLEWFVKTLLPEMKEEAKKDGSNVYKEADKLVSKLSATEVCPIYFPFIMASNVHPNAKAGFLGMTYNHSRAHMIKSVYEGVAFSHRYHYEKLRDSRNTPASCIRLAGGAANSKEWVQIFADIMNSRIEVVDIKETGTFGCAMNVAVALGDYKNYQEAADATVTVRQVVEPIKANVELYNQRYEVYLKLLRALDPVWLDLYNLK